MMKVFLAAGVAALAITAPAAARPDNQDRGQRAERVQRADRPARAERQQVRQQRVERQERRVQRAERPQRIERQERRAQRVERPQRTERQERRAQRIERPQRIERQERRAQLVDRSPRVERAQQRAERSQRIERARDRVADRRIERAGRIERPAIVDRQARMDRIDRRDRTDFARRELRADRVQIDRIQDRLAERRDLRVQRFNNDFLRARADFGPRYSVAKGLGLIDGCPPGLWKRGNGCLPPGQASKLIGMPIAAASSIVAFNDLPSNVRYLYPDTDDYYYRYGDGYLYRVDRDDDLIDWILPLIAGGFLPGQYLPASYMNSYVPSTYGFNSFYPNSPYDCTRYVNGVIYEVDCVTGLIEDVVPLYASGYGVGQMLPSAYGHYNVPYQYRDMYYDTSDYGYWYAPGAIYQYDQGSSLITSVAALLSPGFTVGQPLPMGYSTYNVPYGYRSTYYDTPNDWYRYNNGYVYRVDPTTQLVTAIVASILT